MINHKETDSDLVQSTIDIINSYNAGKERCLILTKNSNEIRPPHTSIDGVGDCVRDPDTLSNNFSKPGIIEIPMKEYLTAKSLGKVEELYNKYTNTHEKWVIL